MNIIDGYVDSFDIDEENEITINWPQASEFIIVDRASGSCMYQSFRTGHIYDFDTTPLEYGYAGVITGHGFSSTFNSEEDVFNNLKEINDMELGK